MSPMRSPTSGWAIAYKRNYEAFKYLLILIQLKIVMDTLQFNTILFSFNQLKIKAPILSLTKPQTVRITCE